MPYYYVSLAAGLIVSTIFFFSGQMAQISKISFLKRRQACAICSLWRLLLLKIPNFRFTARSL